MKSNLKFLLIATLYMLTVAFFISSSTWAMMQHFEEDTEGKIPNNQLSFHQFNEKDHVMLIHGAWHGGWCWEKVTPLLLEKDYIVYSPDLPGHGDNLCPLQDITLKKYVDYIIEQISFIDKPVHLVGHSMSGIIISQVAETIPEKVRSLTYLSAFVLKNNETFLDALKLGKMLQLNSTDNGLGLEIEKNALVETFYGDCSPEVLSLYLPRLCTEPASVVMSSIELSDSRFGPIPRAYIECTEDQALSINRQRAMQEIWPFKVVSTLKTSHAPFFSSPAGLCNALDNVIKQMKDSLKE